MKRTFSSLNRITVIVLIYLFNTRNADAYLDPGTGSYFIQMAIAVFVGGLFALKLFWSKIKLYLKNMFIKKNVNEKHESLQKDS